MPTYTVKFPLEVASKVDSFKMLDETEIKEIVKFNIKSTILTAPGERRGDPNFGVGARTFLFDMENASYSVLRQRILSQIQEYVPYCFIQELFVEIPENVPNAINIKLKYIIAEINKVDNFELSLSI